VSNFCVFLEKRPLMVKFPNFFPKVYMAPPIDVVVFKCRKIFPTGNLQNLALFTSFVRSFFAGRCTAYSGPQH